MATTVIHFRDWDRSDPNAVWIGRANGRLKVKQSPWANPFKVYAPNMHQSAVNCFRTWVTTSGEPNAVWIREHAHDLRDKTLVCACKDKEHPTRPCHGDVLTELAEASSKGCVA